MDDIDADITAVTQTFREHPMSNGDLALLFPEIRFVQEMEGFADTWDPSKRRFLGEVMRDAGIGELHVMVARPDGIPLAQDHALWGDICDELRDTRALVHPLIGLPAAACTPGCASR